jgi:CRISPR-associated endoribonuclease Cas6
MNNFELFSTIVRLRARQSAPLLGFLGRQVQAWFLREVERHDHVLSQELHDRGDAPRPYTLSTVYQGNDPPNGMRTGYACWLRITSLDARLSELLAAAVLPGLIRSADIFPVEFEVLPWQDGRDDSPLNQKTSYAGLMRLAQESEQKRIGLDFISATTFKARTACGGVDKDVPLPNPAMVFGSYLSRWNEYSGMRLPEDLAEFIEECLAINEMAIQSERVQLSPGDARIAATGFRGPVRFAILGDNGRSRWGRRWGELATLTRMLGMYSFYCGTGRQTTRGLGQTFWLRER